MNSHILVCLLIIHIVAINAFLHSKKPTDTGNRDYRVLSTVKIYSNLAEIVQPLGKLPIEFSAEDWSDIRPDSVTLVGTNVTVTQQTVTEKKKSLNHAQIYVRTPSSTTSQTKFLPATMVDEQRNLVKIVDKDIAKEPVYFYPTSDQIVYIDEPAQTKYYVNFTYDTTDAVYLSYLRSNLNWKTRYQMNLFEDPKAPVLIAMADIQNDGNSKVDIEHAELLGGDINFKMHEHAAKYRFSVPNLPAMYGPMQASASQQSDLSTTVSQGQELAGLYIFNVDTPFSVEPKTHYLIPMFQPRITVERYCLVPKYFYGAGSSSGKASRSYRISSDRFLSSGSCIIRESDRLVGETTLPDLAAKNKHEFSIGQDAEVIYKQNVTLVSSSSSFESGSSKMTVQHIKPNTRSTYDINLLLKSFKTKRPVDVELEETFHGSSVKLLKAEKDMTLEGSKIKYKIKLTPNGEKLLSYRVEVTD